MPIERNIPQRRMRATTSQVKEPVDTAISTRTRKRQREEEEEGYVPPGSFLVEDILKHRYKHYHQFLTKWQGYPIQESTWEPVKAFILDDGNINTVFKDYCIEHKLIAPMQQAINIANRKKKMMEQADDREGDPDGAEDDDPFQE